MDDLIAHLVEAFEHAKASAYAEGYADGKAVQNAKHVTKEKQRDFFKIVAQD